MNPLTNTGSRYIKQGAFIAGLSILATIGHAAESNAGLKFIELFTSHGCSSCPAADKILGELLKTDDDLIALEYHVDYWNGLVHGSDGSFADPFSKADYSLRQREYNRARLAGRPGVYTPQAVVNGRTASVGSNKRHIVKALSAGIKQSLLIKIDSDAQNTDVLSVSITGAPSQRKELQGIDIWLVSYLDQATTKITGGENRHLELVNHNIVIDVAALGEVTASGDLSFQIPRPAGSEGCVVLIQEGALSPVYAATACP